MKCPVCKTEVHDKNVCEMCGFDDIRSEFLSQEDADFWMQNVVIPYKDNYEKSDLLPPIDWLEVFKQNAQAKRLFEFSIPAAIKRRIDLDSLKNPMEDDYNEYLMDATLEHFAVVSQNEMIRKHFFDVLKEKYLTTTDFSRTASACVEREGDLAAILSGLERGKALIIEMNSKMKKDVVNLFSKALSEYSFNITIGKGPGSRIVGIDLPAFTTIFFAESAEDIPTEIRNVLSNIIEFNPTQEELDEFHIREIAAIYDIQLTKSTLNVIKEFNANKTYRNIKGTLKFISDYLYLHSEMQQPISVENLKKIIETL